jgi:hypothetical protein
MEGSPRVLPLIVGTTLIGVATAYWGSARRSRRQRHPRRRSSPRVPCRRKVAPTSRAAPLPGRCARWLPRGASPARHSGSGPRASSAPSPPTESRRLRLQLTLRLADPPAQLAGPSAFARSIVCAIWAFTAPRSTSANVAGGRAPRTPLGVAPESNVQRHRTGTGFMVRSQDGDQTQASPASRLGRLSSSSPARPWYSTHAPIALRSYGELVRNTKGVSICVSTDLFSDAERCEIIVIPRPRARPRRIDVAVGHRVRVERVLLPRRDHDDPAGVCGAPAALPDCPAMDILLAVHAREPPSLRTGKLRA